MIVNLRNPSYIFNHNNIVIIYFQYILKKLYYNFIQSRHVLIIVKSAWLGKFKYVPNTTYPFTHFKFKLNIKHLTTV